MKNLALLATLALALSGCETLQGKETATEKFSECVADQAAKLVGQNDMSDAQLKKLTKAHIVRKIGPNGAITMDYRVERVTVVVDPASQKIIRASCG